MSDEVKQGEAKKKPVNRGGEYVVLEASSPTGPYAQVGKVTALTGQAAVKAVASSLVKEGESREFIAVPSKSFKAVSVAIEQPAPRVKIG